MEADRPHDLHLISEAAIEKHSAKKSVSPIDDTRCGILRPMKDFIVSKVAGLKLAILLQTELHI